MEFRLKKIKFLNRTCIVICQNENGPCPLLAIANILLLTNQISINNFDNSYITLDELFQLIGNKITDISLNDSNNSELYINALDILPKLSKGLDLNIFFNQVDKFEFTAEISVFDSLKMPLLHGWIIDETNEDFIQVLSNLSYNHIQNKLIEYNTLCENIPIIELSNKDINEIRKINNDILSNNELIIYKEGQIIDSFLNKSASQLTYHGVLALYNYMSDRQLAIFFRNNHFSTIFFYNGQLFQLVTDLGYLYEDNVVWELLDGIDGIYG